MSDIYLFQIASRQAGWLAARQSAVAGNIANANTPGYEAMDVAPFAETLESTRLELDRTSSRHLGFGPNERPGIEMRKQRAWDVMHSGNTVALEQELLKAAEVKSAFALNISVIKAFHRMLLAGTKG